MIHAVDVSGEFTAYFGHFESPRLFSTIEDFELQLKTFQCETGANYRIRTTERDKAGGLQRRVYTCIKKEQKLHPSRGLREKPSQKTGCQSTFNINRSMGGSYCVTSGKMMHNHPVDPIYSRLEPCRRRLDPAQQESIRPLLTNGTPLGYVCSYIRENFQKYTTPRDLTNLKSKWKRDGYLH
ncbi:hypothetical protein CRM22_006942 [Opisthorchis felineus]|uniref:FAR1 domain-containing protein n=1 Tax=Opisthorchis felineus TaxID=147828 RepID=A0A4S2LQ73_OPIFE|nr:hypothetical protein CRM22_006942 [Opisthorchis felineus]